MSALIEAAGVTHRVGSKALIEDVSLTAAAGETIALVGPNGAGKSTLLRALSGEIACSAGTVRLKGRAPRAYGSRVLAEHRAMLSQSTVVTFPFTVREIVRMGGGERSGRAIDELVDGALTEMDLDGFAERTIGTLSGGEQQRVHFARVMVQLGCGEAMHGPGLLLLDEPTASLDLRHQLDIAAAVERRAKRGVAVIVVLHDLNLASFLAGRVIVLDRGRIAASGLPAETITEDILGRVFGVTDAASRVPPPHVPFVLPQSARKTN